MEGWIVAASVITALASVVAAGSAIWLAFLNKGLVKASQAQVQVSQDEVRVSQAQVTASQEQVAAGLEQARLAQAALDAQIRPIVVPEGDPTFQPLHLNWLRWEDPIQQVALRNLGPGVAFNVMSVLYGCESYLMDDGRRSEDSRNEHWTCVIGGPVPARADIKYGLHTAGGSTFTGANMHMLQYSFNAPGEPSVTAIMQGAQTRIARVTITYRDLSSNKYASIFDFIPRQGWQLVAMLPRIERDLLDLEGLGGQAPEHV